MRLEHLFVNVAVAIVVGMGYQRLAGRGFILAVAVALILLAVLVRTFFEWKGWVLNYFSPKFT